MKTIDRFLPHLNRRQSGKLICNNRQMNLHQIQHAVAHQIITEMRIRANNKSPSYIDKSHIRK